MFEIVGKKSFVAVVKYICFQKQLDMINVNCNLLIIVTKFNISLNSQTCFRYESRKTLMAKVVLKTPKYCDVQLVDTNSNHKDIYLISLLREKTAVQSSGPKRGLVEFLFKEGQRRFTCFDVYSEGSHSTSKTWKYHGILKNN